MSDLPQRTNEYITTADSERYRQCLFDWLVAHAPLWNQINYRRLDEYNDPDGDVWDAEYTDLYDKYAPVLGKAACQQVARKNAEAWRSHFRLLDKYHSDDPSVAEKPSPPGFKGNREDGYDLYGLVRNDLYEFDWDEDKSTLEFGVGDVLEDRYDFDHNERVTLEVRGNPQWDGDDARLELVYDEAADVLRVKHPVRIQPDKLREQRLDAFTHTLDAENTMHTAAIDVGANNTLALVTTTGDTAVYHARPEFDAFQVLSDLIAQLQPQLPDDQYTSKRIQRVYDERGEKRDHHRDAAVKHAAEWLLARNVDTVYVGDLTDVLDTHWQAEVNQKTHDFWSHGQLVDRLELTLGDVGITVEQVSEAGSSSTCPACGSEDVARDGDELHCRECMLDAHSDVVGAWNLLKAEEGPMARPAALSVGRGRDASENSRSASERDGAYWEWNGHEWRPAVFRERSWPVDQTSVGKPASSQPG